MKTKRIKVNNKLREICQMIVVGVDQDPEKIPESLRKYDEYRGKNIEKLLNEQANAARGEGSYFQTEDFHAGWTLDRSAYNITPAKHAIGMEKNKDKMWDLYLKMPELRKVADGIITEVDCELPQPPQSLY